MREHALPQDVTGYKFHIIGNMTLKQFAEVAAGCVVGFLLYQTNLYILIKWPLIIGSAGLGFMAAFVPLEERPLDQWITAFFQALYKPTQYYWKRMTKVPEPFLFEAKTELRSVVGEVDLNPARRQRVKEYLRSIDESPTVPDELENLATQKLNQVMTIFDSQFKLAAVAPDETRALLNANPDTVGSAVDTLSFVGRATGEETAVEPTTTPTTQDTQELEMSNTVLQLFEDSTDPTPLPPPTKPLNIMDVVKESKPVVTLKPVPAQTSFTPPTPPKVEPQQAPLPSDVMDIPAVSLKNEEKEEVLEENTPIAETLQDIHAGLPIISNVFDILNTPPTTPPKEIVPQASIDTTSSLSTTIPAASTTPMSGAAHIEDVMQANPLRQRGKTKVEFKNQRTTTVDKYETVLPHILDMTGGSTTVSLTPPPPAEPTKMSSQVRNVEVPETQDIKVERTVKPTEDVTTTTVGSMESAIDPTLLQLPTQQTTITPSGVVTMNPNLPFPDKPQTPNKVVGMVINKDGISQPNAIVEILNPAGIPARAVKTNPLGQFFITTPLSPGEYMITAEKDGLKFATQQLSVKNSIIEPIEIRSV